MTTGYRCSNNVQNIDLQCCTEKYCAKKFKTFRPFKQIKLDFYVGETLLRIRYVAMLRSKIESERNSVYLHVLRFENFVREKTRWSLKTFEKKIVIVQNTF